MELSQWLSLSVAFVGLVAVQIWNAMKHKQSQDSHVRDVREAEVRQAKERGAMEQRLSEAEEDIGHLGDKIRVIEGGLSALEQGMATVGTKVGSLDKTVHRVDEKIDRLFDHLLSHQKQEH